MRELQKVFQVTSEGDTLILGENPTDVCFDKNMDKTASKDLFLPASSTRVQDTTLHWNPRIVSQKGRQTHSCKGRRSSIKNKRQLDNWQHKKSIQMSSKRSSVIPENTE